MLLPDRLPILRARSRPAEMSELEVVALILVVVIATAIFESLR